MKQSSSVKCSSTVKRAGAARPKATVKRGSSAKQSAGFFAGLGNSPHRRTIIVAGVVAVFGLAGSMMLLDTNAARHSANAAPRTGSQTVASLTTAEPADCSQTRIQQLVDSVSQANIEANMQKLVQDDTKPLPNQSVSRYVGAPGNKQKVDWMKQQLADHGLVTRSQAFKSGGWSLSNPIGRLNGTTASVYAVGAHIDSMSEDPMKLAPGADDNASGVAAVIEAARVLKPFESCMKASVDFIGFNDEEVGMRGSSTYANSYGKLKTNFKGLYNLDMIGYAGVNGECIKSYYKNAAREQAMAQRVADANTKYNVGLLPVTVKQYPYSDVDSASFWNAKMPATFQGECIADDGEPDLPGYHSTTDTLGDVSYPMVTKVTKAIVAATAELASQ